MRIKGRHWVLLWLALFLFVAAVVTTRSSVAFGLSRELTQLKSERASLEGRKTEVEQRIRSGSSRMVLLERAHRAGLHVASDSEITLFPFSGSSAAGAR